MEWPPLPKKRGLPSEAVTKCPSATLAALCLRSARSAHSTPSCSIHTLLSATLAHCNLKRPPAWLANYPPHRQCSSGANALQRGQGPGGQEAQHPPPRRSAVLVRLSQMRHGTRPVKQPACLVCVCVRVCVLVCALHRLPTLPPGLLDPLVFSSYLPSVSFHWFPVVGGFSENEEQGCCAEKVVFPLQNERPHGTTGRPSSWQAMHGSRGLVGVEQTDRSLAVPLPARPLIPVRCLKAGPEPPPDPSCGGPTCSQNHPTSRMIYQMPSALGAIHTRPVPSEIPCRHLGLFWGFDIFFCFSCQRMPDIIPGVLSTTVSSLPLSPSPS